MGNILQTFTFDRNSIKDTAANSAQTALDLISMVADGRELDKGKENIVGALRSYLGVFDGDRKLSQVGNRFVELARQDKEDAYGWLLTRGLWRFVIPNGTNAEVNAAARSAGVVCAPFCTLFDLLEWLSERQGDERFLFFQEFCELFESDAAWSLSGEQLLEQLEIRRQTFRASGGFPPQRKLLEDLEAQYSKSRDNLNTVLFKALRQTGLFEFRYAGTVAIGVGIATNLPTQLSSRLEFVLRHPVRARPYDREGWYLYLATLAEELPSEPHAPAVPSIVEPPVLARFRDPVVLAKPFVLLAGISGTGKTRFVRDQARLSAPLEAADRLANYELVCVRPDWHEPSDLLGYVSRVAGERFVVTPFLRFIVNAWREAVAVPETLQLQPLEHITTFWLCLDEMNLAPVEQYFADFLSIVETRQWTSSGYSCDPILPIHKLGLSPSTLELLRNDLGLGEDEALWRRFSEHGIPLPPNLVVVGTVNMDETTHGFSRKVIDRAITLDFGVFFPNDFDSFFAPNVTNSRLQFPRWTSVTEAELAGVIADPGGARSLRFLSEVNSVLSSTPFELAFRALNELLVSLRAFAPKSEAELCAVWDDFVMTKVLPRLEGDGEKLRLTNSGKEQVSILTRLTATLAGHGLTPMAARPDLYRCVGDAPASVRTRSPAALARMQGRLLNHGFTSFWP